MKKVFLFVLIFFSVSLNLFSWTKDDVKSFVLENGLEVYFLMDTTTAFVRSELVINAGFSAAEKKNTMALNLCANLYEMSVEQDCVRSEITCTPSYFEDSLISFKEKFEPVSISDSELKIKTDEFKAYAENFSSSVTGFINGAIDSMIFSGTPWKEQSGINPSEFKSISSPEVRAAVSEIHSSLYVPSNAKLYVSGNITEQTVFFLVQKYFSEIKSPSSIKSSENSAAAKISEKKISTAEKIQKFVLTHDDFSEELTQIVMQFTDFSETENEILASIFNENSSEFKRLLLRQRNLSIRGGEYINVSAVNSAGTSRLLIQSILEKTRVSPAVQGDLFVQMATEKERILNSEYENAEKRIHAAFTETCGNSSLLMKKLADFNAAHSGENLFDFYDSEKYESFTKESLNSLYEQKKPFVFLLVNTKNYTKYRREFERLGYTQITDKKARWFELDRFAKKTNAQAADTNPSGSIFSETDFFDDILKSQERFTKENESQFSLFTLKNNIPVAVKNVPGANSVVIGLSIEDGELAFAETNPGLASVLTNALAVNIRNTLDRLFFEGRIKGSVKVNARTNASNSLITTECSSEEFLECAKAVSDAVIFGEITPALADGIIYDIRSQWRITTGAESHQLLCEAVRTVYQTPYTNLFDNKKEKPEQMEFSDIAKAYPVILDSSRFSLIFAGGTGNIEELKDVLSASFGELSSLEQTESKKTEIPQRSIPKKTKRIQLTHQFLTDISADKAGPRPLILVPTTDFSDPALYVLESPSLSSTDCALFNALLFRLEQKIQQKLPQGQTVSVKIPDLNAPFASITITKIKSTEQTERIYNASVQELIHELEQNIKENEGLEFVKNFEKTPLLLELENTWLTREFSKIQNLEGTVELIHDGNAVCGDFLFYLKKYEAVNRAGLEDYFIIAKSFFENKQPLAIYSRDSKR